MTYGDVADQANALAAALESLGLRRGEPPAVDPPNRQYHPSGGPGRYG